MRVFITLSFFILGGLFIGILMCPPKYTEGVTYPLIITGMLAGLFFGLGLLMALEKE